MQVKEALAPTATNIWQTYTLDVRQRTVMGGTASENFIKTSLKKTLSGQNEHGYIFDLHVLNRGQSNLTGIRAMENDLATLQKELVVQTDFTGTPVRILNLAAINDKWTTYKKEFLKKFEKEEGIAQVLSATDELLTNNQEFTETFIESELGTLLFPPIYSMLSEKGETCQQQKIFSSFFGQTDLPLKLTTTLKERNVRDIKIQLQRRGELHSDEFDFYNARKLFRKLADNMKLATPVTADYMETYDLDKYHSITHAGQLLGVRIEALFSFEQIARLTSQNKAT